MGCRSVSRSAGYGRAMEWCDVRRYNGNHRPVIGAQVRGRGMVNAEMVEVVAGSAQGGVRSSSAEWHRGEGREWTPPMASAVEKRGKSGPLKGGQSQIERETGPLLHFSLFRFHLWHWTAKQSPLRGASFTAALSCTDVTVTYERVKMKVEVKRNRAAVRGERPYKS